MNNHMFLDATVGDVDSLDRSPAPQLAPGGYVVAPAQPEQVLDDDNPNPPDSDGDDDDDPDSVTIDVSVSHAGVQLSVYVQCPGDHLERAWVDLNEMVRTWTENRRV